MADEESIVPFLQTASDYYNQVEFKSDALFNNPAPAYWISFSIGGGLSVVGIIYWLFRVHQSKMDLAKMNIPFTGSLKLRSMISRSIDNDDPAYVVISFGAFSFLFLGGLQLNYEWTLIAMFLFYSFSSLGDSARIMLATASTDSVSHLVQDSCLVHSHFRKTEATLKPANVYEDLGRGNTIVFMVFATQTLLISFIALDVYRAPTTKCHDGSSGCPIVGTLGSWGLYVLGIFMASVHLLGPKTNYGQSEQNPAYWIHLLIAAKKTGAKITWFDPVENAKKERSLSPGDFRIWFRFVLSFLVNGVGFHLLVHALPIQIAAQTSLTGVVIRALGMVYLVDLDDTAGYPLTIVESDPDTSSEEEDGNKKVLQDSTATSSTQTKVIELSDEARHILSEAQAKLDALYRGEDETLVQQRDPRNSVKAGKVMLGGAMVVPTPTQDAETHLSRNDRDGNNDD